MINRKELIEEILKRELEMFLTVNSREKADCQKDPRGFANHRRAQFSAWPPEALESYLLDLKEARDRGINLMTVKYALMEGLLPLKNDNPVISRIVSLQYQWQREMFEKFPRIMAGARNLSSKTDTDDQVSFETYLKGELETCSDRTLALLHADMVKKKDAGISMSEEVYRFLAAEYGYASLEEAEQKAGPKT